MGWKMPSLTWWHCFACLTTLKYGLGQNSTDLKYAYGDFPDLLFVILASFKLV